MSRSALQMGYVTCHTCGLAEPEGVPRCPRCRSALHGRKPESIQRCMALVIASCVAWIPANFLPVMYVTQLGNTTPSTILGGVHIFWSLHSYFVAIVIFTASFLIPGLKLLSLVLLCAVASGKITVAPHNANKVYAFTEFVGRWSMIDPFVVILLVCLIRFGNVMSITPGPAALSFAFVVILTMVAAHAFDPRLIWDRFRENPSHTDK